MCLKKEKDTSKKSQRQQGTKTQQLHTSSLEEIGIERRYVMKKYHLIINNNNNKGKECQGCCWDRYPFMIAGAPAGGGGRSRET